MNNTLQFFPLINALCVCTKTLQFGRCDFPGEAIASQIFPGALSLHCGTIGIHKCKHPKWNFSVLQMLMALIAISLHFIVSSVIIKNCYSWNTCEISAKYLWNTCKTQNLYLHHTWFALQSLRTLSAPLATQNAQNNETLEFCCIPEPLKELIVHNVDKVVITLWQ